MLRQQFSIKMSATTNRRMVIFFLLLFTIKLTCAQYEVPAVKVQAFKPKGFRASIPDAPNLSLFVFQGNINRKIDRNHIGAISGEVLNAKNGRWTYEDPNLELKLGDIINYYVFVSKDRAGYVKDNLSYTVNGLDDRDSTGGDTGPTTTCEPTATVVRGGSACAGQTIFEDNFESLRENVWQIEQYIPIYMPEYPFVSYQHLAADPTVSAAGGNLRIAPKLQQNLPGYTEDSIYNGSINLFSGCTASAEACMKQSWGADILPPIVSGKITTKAFAFKYGTVYVRAKLPKGDWIYPEILLEPFLKKYGSQHYASGVIKIASARGNKELSSGITDYSNKVLYGGAIMDFQCHDVFLSRKELDNGQGWGDDFHEYSVRWAPERITLSVDGEEWARIEPAASGLRGRMPDTCRQLPATLLAMGTKMAPFDDHFYITLGVAAGSITEFPDGVSTVSNRPKPWSNQSRKALLNFWQDMQSWLATWNQPQMLVDYVKVVAL